MDANFSLLPGEEVHTLIEDELYILQKQGQFRFGMDAVLLANWVRVRSGAKVIDLGTGTGIIPLLLAYKRNPGLVMGLEIQSEMAKLANRSVAFNQLEDQIEILKYDLREIKDLTPPNRFSLVVSNPPYFPVGGGKINPTDAKAVARHEICCTLADLIEAAAYLLGSRGRFAFIHRAERIPEICRELSRRNLELKRMRLIQPHINQPANLVLLETVMDGKPGLTVEPNLIIYDDERNYTPEVLEIYAGIGGNSNER